jgi:hypothetical protein
MGLISGFYIHQISPIILPTTVVSINETRTLTDIISGLIDGGNKISVEINENDVCYWIRPTIDGKYIIEIKKYQSMVKKCFGLDLDESRITLENGVNIIGDTDCLCNGEKYSLERVIEGERVDVKITKV